MAAIDTNYIEELTKSKAETFGSESGITSVPKVVEINTKVENVIQSLDGLDQDKESGSERQGAKDEDGKTKVSYGFCSECGKPLEKPSKDNLCSLKCQMTHNSKHIMTDVKETQDKAENVNGKLQNCTSAMNSLMSSMAQMTALLAEVESAGLDAKYVDYFKVKINTVIQYLKSQIEQTMVLKNEKLLNQLQKAKNGMDTTAVSIPSLTAVQKAAEAAQKLLEVFQQMYDKIYQAILMAKPLCLQPESLHFQMTPRSMFKHPGMLVNQLPNNNVNNSSGNVLFADNIMKIAKTAFPPIKEAEYLMPPAAFNVRKQFSQENQKGVMTLIDSLKMLMKGPTEPLPKYEDLSVSNIHYLLFLLLSWGPEGLNHYAMPLYPP